jgi:RNA polymerase sigma-70 factor (ECF subfamily)
MEREDEYALLFAKEYATVVQAVYFILFDRHRAEDVAQEAFAQLHLHWRKVSSYQRPDAWVRRVAIRIAVRHAKRELRRSALEREAQLTEAAGSADLDLMRAIGRLPAMQRAVVVLFYFEDRPMAEVAHVLSISEATGYVHLHRARRRLGELLGEEVGEDVG